MLLGSTTFNKNVAFGYFVIVHNINPLDKRLDECNQHFGGSSIGKGAERK